MREEAFSEKKSKAKLRILISNMDEDPLNLGKTYDMIERQPILFQRSSDIDYGIWWINSQKKYIKKIRIKDPGAIPFYFFLIKEIILTHKARRRFKEQDGYGPDGIEELNFGLIDEIFNKVVERLGIDLAYNESIAEKLKEIIKKKERFTISELAKELNVDPTYTHVLISNPTNNILSNFDLRKEKRAGKKGPQINVYIKNQKI